MVVRLLRYVIHLKTFLPLEIFHPLIITHLVIHIMNDKYFLREQDCTLQCHTNQVNKGLFCAA